MWATPDTFSWGEGSLEGDDEGTAFGSCVEGCCGTEREAKICATCCTAGVLLAGVLAPHRVGPADIYPPVPGVTNPDITQDNINQTICNPLWSTSSIRPPSSYTSALKLTQMKRYGLKGSPKVYEEDHLISLELGGSPKDPNNLWPEAYFASIADGGARVYMGGICFDCKEHCDIISEEEDSDE